MFKRALSLTRRSNIVRAMNEPSSNVKPIYSKPIKVNLNEANDLKFCIDCKYFLGNKTVKQADLGFCQKYGTISVIDGKITYDNVEIARQYKCHGNDFEPIDRKEIDPESHKAFFT